MKMSDIGYLIVRVWNGEQWPEKRVSIVDETKQALFISARYTDMDESIRFAEVTTMTS